MKKIRTKIILAIILCSAVIAILVGAVSIIKSNQIIQSEAKDKLLYLANTKSNQVDDSLVAVENAVADLSNVFLNTFDIEKAKSDPSYVLNYQSMLEPIVKSFSQNTKNVMGTYVVIDPSITKEAFGAWFADVSGNGEYTKQQLTKASEYDPNNSAMAWYYDPIKAKKGVWTDPYINKENKKNMVSYTAPVFKNNTLIGVVGMDMLFDTLSKEVLNIKVYDTGEAFLLNDKFNFLVSKTYKNTDNLATVSNGIFKSAVDDLKKSDSGVITLDSNGTKMFAAFEHIANGGALVITVPQSEVFKGMRDLTVLLVLIVLIGILFSAAISFYLGKKISLPILRVTELINKTAGYDLAYDSSFVPLTKRKDESGLMANSMATMRSSLRDLIKYLMDLTDTTTKNIQATQSLSNTVQDEANEISATIEELSAGMQETAASSEEISAAVEEVETTLNKVVERSQKGFVFSKEASKRALSMKEQSLNAVSESNNIYQDVKLYLKNAIEQSKSVEQINVLADNILNIASQTNLLALNAAIEAARAGEAGKGFVVVADEIKKLAEQAASTTSEIQRIVKTVTSSVSNLSEGSKKILSFIDEKVNPDYSKFVEIAELYNGDAEMINSMMMEFSAAAGQLHESISNISSAIGDIAKTISESSAGIEDISARMADITQNIHEVTDSSRENAKNVETLKNIISKFKIN